MIVLIAGIKRSGSTAQYNMVRLIMSKRYDNLLLQGHDYELEDVTLIKKHPFDKVLYLCSDHIFTTDRDIKEVEDSLKRFGVENRYSIESMQEHLELYKTRSHHFTFKEITQNPKECIKRISVILNIPVDVEEIYKEYKKIKPQKEYNPVTMLFPNHVTK